MALLVIIGVVLVLWIGVPTLLGWCAYRATRKRWHQVAVTALGLWLPFWDVAPGYLLYRQAIREVGGIRILRTVEADGYLDALSRDCIGCWGDLHTIPYTYLEVERQVRDVTIEPLTSLPGYYQYSLGKRGSAECAPFDALPNADALRDRTVLDDDECVVVVRRGSPISRYEFRLEGRRFRPWFAGVVTQSFEVVDRTTGGVIAAATRINFVSWLGRWAFVPGYAAYTDENGVPIRLDRADVIRPVSSKP